MTPPHCPLPRRTRDSLDPHADDLTDEAGGPFIIGWGVFPDSARLSKMLTALQLAGWIDLYRADEDFYYRVRSEHKKTINSLMTDREAS